MPAAFITIIPEQNSLHIQKIGQEASINVEKIEER